jgi:quercetin dioxygenase-like cupin family protein
MYLYAWVCDQLSVLVAHQSVFNTTVLCRVSAECLFKFSTLGEKIMIAGRFDERPEKEVTKYGSTGTTVRWLINRDNGARTFAMRRFIVQPGGEIPIHEHEEDHEIYILSGEGIAFTPDQEVTLEADMFLYVPPKEKHGYRNTGKNPLVFICLIPLLD